MLCFSLVVNNSRFDLCGTENEVGVGPAGGDGGSCEPEEIEGVAILSEETSVVQVQRKKEDGCGAVDYSVRAAGLIDDSWVLGAELEGVLFHFT